MQIWCTRCRSGSSVRVEGMRGDGSREGGEEATGGGLCHRLACRSYGDYMSHHVPLVWQLIVSAFPGPDLPEGDRPWNRSAPMDDETFKEECKGWDVNAVALEPSNFKIFGAMFRDDFSLFDEYVYKPLPEVTPPPSPRALPP